MRNFIDQYPFTFTVVLCVVVTTIVLTVLY